MPNAFPGPAFARRRLSSAVALGLLCAAAVLFALAAPTHAATTSLPVPRRQPPAAPGARQTIATALVPGALSAIHTLETNAQGAFFSSSSPAGILQNFGGNKVSRCRFHCKHRTL